MVSEKLRCWRALASALGADRKRAPRRAQLQLETLEGRRVPSSMMGHGHGPNVAAHVMTRGHDRGDDNDDQGDRNRDNGGHDHNRPRSRQVIGVGFAIKTPKFYELYTGRRDPGLNAREATARVVRGNLVLTGTMQGRINTSPEGEDEESYFAFGINRGTTSAIAPFPGRPNIKFDAVVVVNVEEDGISATVTDLTKPPGTGTTELPSSAVRVEGKHIRVVAPLSLLTPTATLPLRQWRVNLWPRTELPPSGPETVASFVPENAMFRIFVPRGRRG